MGDYLCCYFVTVFATDDFDPSHNVTHFCLLSDDFPHPIYKLLPPLLLMIDKIVGQDVSRFTASCRTKFESHDFRSDFQYVARILV